MGPSSGPVAEAEAVIHFGGCFELRPAARTLLRDGTALKLGGRAFDLLVALVDRRDRVVPKSELLDIVWPRLVVEENNLQVHVLALRKLLGPQAIATVPGRGYRFTAGVEEAHGPTAPGTHGTPPCHAATAPAGDGALMATTGFAPATALIGRGIDGKELDAALREHRLVTLLGAGGVGKSTLARHVAQAAAERFADGMVWVDLTPVRDDAGVVDAAAAATRSALARGGGAKALAAALAPGKLLLVLDNAEHVLDGVVALAVALHAACPGVHLLVTSQAPLRLAAEQLYRLDPLALPDPQASLAEAAASAAVQLFVARVRARDRHFVLDAHNLAAVVSLTRRLDGLPLAIEMAAARVPALSPAQLAAALHERFRVLTRGDRSAPARQHTLAAALSWTHDLLGAEEQVVLRRLGVFVGSFSLPAAQAVCRDDGDDPAHAGAGAPQRIDEWQVLDALAVLVDRSLITPPVGEPPRYRLLETPKAFALQRLAAAADDEAAARRRHLAYFRSLYEAAYEDHLWARRSAADWLDTFAPDADDGLAALDHAIAHDAESAVALAPGLARALVHRHAERFAVWHRTEPLLNDALPAPVRACWQLGFGQFWGVANVHRSRPHARAAAALFRAAGHAAGEYRAQSILAITTIAGTGERPDAALAHMRELEQADWPADLRYLGSWAEVSRLATAGRFDEAYAAGLACMELIRQSGHSGRLFHDEGMMYVAIMADRLDDAIEHGLAGMRRVRAHQRHAPASGTELMLLIAWLLKGDVARAREIGPAVWEAACSFNHKAAAADALTLLAAREGRVRAAMILAGYAAADYTRSATKRLPTYQRCGDAAEAIAAQALSAEEIAALQARGRQWPDAGVPALAFGTVDVIV